jgi:hypothetical protein
MDLEVAGEEDGPVCRIECKGKRVEGDVDDTNTIGFQDRG